MVHAVQFGEGVLEIVPGSAFRIGGEFFRHSEFAKPNREFAIPGSVKSESAVSEASLDHAEECVVVLNVIETTTQAKARMVFAKEWFSSKIDRRASDSMQIRDKVATEFQWAFRLVGEEHFIYSQNDRNGDAGVGIDEERMQRRIPAEDRNRSAMDFVGGNESPAVRDTIRDTGNQGFTRGKRPLILGDFTAQATICGMPIQRG